MRRQGSIAKITTPRLFEVVARERLFSRLDENRGRPVIWFDSPPGAGKTTLAVSFLEARGIPALWYQVDPADADPANLFHFLALAAQAMCPGKGMVLPRLMPEHLSDLPAFSRTFFRKLFSRLPNDTVIVFDNYQDAPDDAAMHEILRLAASQVPAGGSLYFLSRIDAPPLFSQLAASGAMFKLHWAELKLTIEETREIAAARNVRDDWLVQALHRQSEGWAAGMTLMLERLDHKETRAGALPQDTQQSVFDYFATLIFDQIPGTNRKILLSVAFLPYVTLAMANTLSNDAEAGELLEYLHRRRLFTDRRRGEIPAYQFHALFRDFLQRRARCELSESEIHYLLRSSIDALEIKGDVDSAMDLRIVGKDWDGMIRTIVHHASQLLSDGRRQTLLRWIQAIPPEVEAVYPWVTYWHGLAETQTEPQQGMRTLGRALSQFQESGELQGQILCLTAQLNSAFVGHFALDSMNEWLDALLARLPGLTDSYPSADLELRVWGVLCSTLFYIRPWDPWTAGAAERVDRLLGPNVDPNVAVAAASSAMALASQSGNFELGDRLERKSSAMAVRSNASPSESIWWLVQKGYLRFVQARYEESLTSFNDALRLAEANGMRTSFVAVPMFRFMVEFRVSGWAVANATLAEAESIKVPSYPVADALLYIYQARRAQFCGANEDAANLATLSYKAVLRTGSKYLEMIYGIMCAELFAMAGRFQDAKKMLTASGELIDKAPIFEWYRGGLIFTDAFVAHSAGNTEMALEQLRNALMLAKCGNAKFFLRFLECGMPVMFSLALEHGIEVDLVQLLVRTFRLKPPANAPDHWPWPIRIHTLGRFEIRVDGKPLEYSRKTPKKTLALLKALIAYGGHDVSELSICDALWPDDEADAAREALGITVLRLRKLLGNHDAVVQQGGRLSLDCGLCWIDAFRFEQRAAQRESGEMHKALEAYGGSFLPQDEGELWSVPTRERLRGKFIHLLATHGAALEALGDTESAISLYYRGVDADPIVEAFHQGLMRCYQLQGRHTEAISVYRRLRQTLSAILSVAPSAESRRLYETSMQACGETGSVTETASVVPIGRRESR